MLRIYTNDIPQEQSCHWVYSSYYSVILVLVQSYQVPT